MRRLLLVVLGAGLAVGGCVAPGLSGGDPLAVNDTLRQACGGYMTDDNSITYLLSVADSDRQSGYTKSYETTVFLETCSMQASAGAADYDACSSCRLAVLDQIYGQ